MRELFLYEIDPDYLRFLHGLDYRVSVKYNNRPFVGIIVMINGTPYVLPLTSQTTTEREKEGKKKRAAKVTTFVRDTSGEEIANILHNNMIPVADGTYTMKDINADVDTYESNEIRYIRKHKERIIAKAQKVHDKRIENKDWFLRRICCNFELLESRYTEYNKND